MKHILTNAQRAAMLPDPSRTIAIPIPLDLLPEYFRLHGIEPAGYNPKTETVLVSKMGGQSSMQRTV